MNVLVLCNVGVRDVALDGALLSRVREDGRRYLEQYEEVAPRLSFPIIEPILRYILGREGGRIDRLVLYGTDQPDPGHQAQDTVHTAALAARRLPEIFQGAVARAEAVPIQGINPSLYDEAFELFHSLLGSLPHEDVGTCYVVICGGIPACNTALLLQGVRHFGPRLRVVYKPDKGEPQELRAGQQVIVAFREAAAMEHLRRLDFAIAVPLLKELDAESGLVELVRYAEQRLAFDFASAQQALLDALREGTTAVREFVNKRLRHDLDPLLQPGESQERFRALLRELVWNASITFQHRRYADFLARVYRFQEAVLRYLVETVFGLATSLGPDEREANQARWEEAIQANRALLAFLESREVEGRPLDWRSIGRPTYKALLAYAAQGGSGLDAEGRPLVPPNTQPRLHALLDRVNALDRLVELRHRTIIGHDFVGISEEQVLAHYKGTRAADGRARTPVEGMEEILHMLDIRVDDNPYQAVSEFVVSRLHRGATR